MDVSRRVDVSRFFFLIFKFRIVAVSEENRRFLTGKNSHGRYNFYNARIELIFGERSVLAVCSKPIKKDLHISIISI